MEQFLDMLFILKAKASEPPGQIALFLLSANGARAFR